MTYRPTSYMEWDNTVTPKQQIQRVGQPMCTKTAVKGVGQHSHTKTAGAGDGTTSRDTKTAATGSRTTSRHCKTAAEVEVLGVRAMNAALNLLQLAAEAATFLYF